MESDQFLSTIESRLDDQINRGREAGHGVSVDQLNWCPDANKWSMAQIFEHMMLGNAPYLHLVKDAIASAPTKTDGPIHHTFAGKLMMRGAGPSGNVPPPKQIVPAPGPYTPDIVDRWAAQTQAFVQLVKSAHQVDLSTRFRNPFIRVVKMNLADSFMILAEHTERHLQQLEALQRQLKTAK